jgi:hypothetical protein
MIIGANKMRDITRITRIITKLEAIWSIFPDWRLGQVLFVLVNLGNADIFYLEDDALEKGLDLFISNFSKKREE